MILIKLIDGTKVFAKSYEVEPSRIRIEDIRYVGKDRPPAYLEDGSMNISRDAIDVFFIIHKGEKEVK